MAGVYRGVSKVSWVLGVISLVLGLLPRLVRVWADAVDWSYSTRGALLLAAVLFLCTLATREMERAGSS